jgi:adenylate kinase family enzyme
MPGTGKGTYGKRMGEYYGIPVLVMSDLLRQSGVDTTTGRLIEDSIVIDVL